MAEQSERLNFSTVGEKFKPHEQPVRWIVGASKPYETTPLTAPQLSP